MLPGGALAQAMSLHPDLVLMDVYLPDGSGLDVLRSLLGTQNPPDVIVVSAAREIASVRVAMQADVDELFRLRRVDERLPARPTKGHSAPTLELVRNAVQEAATDVSATEVADVVGISRATAQRYLTYLAQHGVVTLRLRYGVAGRPEHRYHMSRRRDS